jgi:hypothetical protein
MPRALLLTAALLSVAALSLAGFRPFHWDNSTAVEVYATLSYAVAALSVVVGLLTTTLSSSDMAELASGSSNCKGRSAQGFGQQRGVDRLTPG